MNNNSMKGFTLIEIMIVLAIISILAGIGYPQYLKYVNKAKRIDGISTLLQVMEVQERYYANNFKYTKNLADLGYTVDDNNKLLSTEKHYLIFASDCDTQTINQCVKLSAEPQGSISSDGTITLDSIGRKLPASHW